MNISKEKIRKAIVNMIHDKITPGVVFLVSIKDQIIFYEAFGTTNYQDKGTKLVTNDTIYDIASVTKIVTATAILMLLDKKSISIEDKLAKFFPACSYGDKITIRHLLTHTSGISVQMSKLAKLSTPQLIHQAILNAPISSQPGAQVMFTNANSYLLGKIIETASKEPFSNFLQKELLQPLNMYNTLFCPPKQLWSKIAPTEITLERGLIQGKVHDESAFALGGSVGHAGLFSTAADLNNFCRLWLHGGVFDSHRMFSESLAQVAVKNQVSDDQPETGFGWMLNRGWMGKFGALSFGHTAFTGPSIIITPDHKMSAVLMTNRTYPHRGNADRHVYQEKIMDALFEAMIN
ncbi:MAG: serine hydrolase domain-containing protein [bacterium]|nr:serine hydrolase domain-containing protein [bacterium]